ncbi:MAG: hypothetical protein Q8R20_01785 [Nanoarchaeota archaeon]|nr:hypothetical protein [Nanoarchaeota archaeon]
MVKVQDFTAGNFEENIQHMGERVAEYKEGRDVRSAPEREIVKEALKYEPQAAPLPAGTSGSDDGSLAAPGNAARIPLAPDYMHGGDAEGMREAVERLAETALCGDLKGSLKDARKLSPYLEDAFHDALVDKVFPEMKKRGLI